jgi:uncharacterized protein YbbC (DUF1343 family)/CubicO group peptidase (beta-lactamase class C family)
VPDGGCFLLRLWAVPTDNLPVRLLKLLSSITALLAFLAAPLRANDAFFPAKIAEIDGAIRLAIADGRLPGATVWIEHGGSAHHRAYGSRAVQPAVVPNGEDTIYDTASLTKVIATTTAILKLYEAGKLALEDPVSKFLPSFQGGDKAAVTIRHLLTHTAGTKPGISLGGWSDYDGGIAKACSEPLAAKPGTIIRYSDINFILLGEIVRKASGRPLDEFAMAEIFTPLGMKDTSFKPAAGLRDRIAPTTSDVEPGAVHDPTARKLGGVAGHAGLFSTSADLARFARMLLNGGELDGTRILKSETVALMTSVHTPADIPGRRGLGWDIDTGYSGPRGRWFPIGSYGHTGWTGGSLWIDPFSKTFVLLLSNRNHPTEAGNVLPLRMALGTLAAESVRGFNFLHVPGALAASAVTPAAGPRSIANAEVLTGIDVLAREKFAPLKGLRVGLITNHTGIDRQRRRTVDLLAKAEGVQLVALFSPEHGIAGKLDEKVGDSKDEATGLPVYSLYGEGRTPKPEHLAGVDALVFDIQDIGCRFYTYISTMGESLTAAAKAKKKFFVLDRPNPIGGVTVEGPVLEGERSFVGWHDIPLRHGMSVGELARMFNEERKLGADLTVIRCEGWKRDQWFDQTNLPWINPSPNMRSLYAAALYPGVGMLEFCAVSVGRGTDRPFELFGAPYLDDLRFAAEMNAANLPGVKFMPARFTPSASVHANKECKGVQIVVTNRDALNAVDVGIELGRALQKFAAGSWQPEKAVRLLFHPATLKGMQEMRDLSAIKAQWVEAREAFAPRRARFLLY